MGVSDRRGYFWWGGCVACQVLCLGLQSNVPLEAMVDATFISTQKTASRKKKKQGSGIRTPGRLSLQLLSFYDKYLLLNNSETL